MRKRRRHDGWAATAALLTALVIFGLATTTTARAEATSTPTGELAATSTPTTAATPTATAIATATLSPTPEFGCEDSWASAYPDDHIVRGQPVVVTFHAFEPNARVTLLLIDADQNESEIGTDRSDAGGEGAVRGVIPDTTPIGFTELRLVSDQCIDYVYVLVIGSAEAMTVDDDTPMLGQLVTIAAGGFRPDSPIDLTIDSYAIQGECYPRACRSLSVGSADALGAVVMHVRIPRNVDPGVHHLYATGYSPDEPSDLTVGARIRVVGPSGTLPPTDTAS